MPVLFDTAVEHTSTNDTSWEHTMADGYGRIIIVGVSNRYDVAEGMNDIATITYGGDEVTERAYQLYADRLQAWLWAITAPSIGANNIVVDVDPHYAGCNLAFVSASYIGVNAVMPFGIISKKTGFVDAGLLDTVVLTGAERPIAICASIGTTVHTPSADATERGEAGQGSGGAHTRCSINDEPTVVPSAEVGFSAGGNTRKILISTYLKPMSFGHQIIIAA